TSFLKLSLIRLVFLDFIGFWCTIRVINWLKERQNKNPRENLRLASEHVSCLSFSFIAFILGVKAFGVKVISLLKKIVSSFTWYSGRSFLCQKFLKIIMKMTKLDLGEYGKLKMIYYL